MPYISTLRAVGWDIRWTALPFCCASAASLAVAIALVTLRHSEWRPTLARYLCLAHLAPLLCAPIILTSVITGEAEHVWGGHARDSAALLAAFGFLFHTGLAWLMLERVLDWPQRVAHWKHVRANLHGARVATQGKLVGVTLVLLGSPALFLLAILFVFNESMVAAPYFMSRKTAVAGAVEFLNSSRSMVVSAALAVTLLSAIFLLLAASWIWPRLLGRRLLGLDPVS
jgi:hypothetical protein